jgi:hypothetical protein
VVIDMLGNVALPAVADPDECLRKAEDRQFNPVPDHKAFLICGKVTCRNRVRRPSLAESFRPGCASPPQFFTRSGGRR